MDKPIDENADLEPHQLASMNPGIDDHKPALPADGQPGAPVSQTAGTIPVAPHPTTNRFPWNAVNNPEVKAPVAPPAPELPPAKPADKPEETASTGPVATAPIVTYDADLNQTTSIAASTGVPAKPSVPPAAGPAPSAPQPSPQPPKPLTGSPFKRHTPPPSMHSPAKAVRPVKIFSHQTRRVWRAKKFGRQYKVGMLVLAGLIIILFLVVWIAVGSPTDLNGFNFLEK